MRARTMMVAAAVLLAAGGLAGAWHMVRGAAPVAGPPYASVRAIVDRHCVGCHSAHPVVAAFPLAPAGVELDTAAQLRQHAERVRVRTAIDRTMPLLNKTGMSDAERRTIDEWVSAGAHTGSGDE